MKMTETTYTIVKDPKILPKLAEVLDLVFKTKKSSSKIVRDCYSYDNRHFSKNRSIQQKSVNSLNECLLNHRFDEALKILWIMGQDRSCFHSLFHKGLMIALENLFLNDEHEVIKKFSSDMKGLPGVNKLEVQLEFLIYSLKNDITDQLDNSKKRKIKIIPYIDQFHTAFSSIMNYLTWLDITQGGSTSKDENLIAFNVIACFKKLIDNPGIWDIFVLKLIEILDYYGKYDEIEEVLKKYVEQNPNHVNAYVYICVHLHKHGDSNKFVHYAKLLFNLCPSDERVLLLVQKWNERGKYLKKRLKIIFMFLDYPVNGNKLLGWQLLLSHLGQAISSKKSSAMKSVKSAWSLRCNSWKYMHFTSTKTHSENVDLVLCKVKVLKILDPNNDYIISKQDKFQVMNEYLVPSAVTQPTFEDFSSLYHLEDMKKTEYL